MYINLNCTTYTLLFSRFKMLLFSRNLFFNTFGPDNKTCFNENPVKFISCRYLTRKFCNVRFNFVNEVYQGSSIFWTSTTVRSRSTEKIVPPLSNSVNGFKYTNNFALFRDFRNLDSLVSTVLAKRKINILVRKKNPLTSQSSQQAKQFPIVNQITAVHWIFKAKLWSTFSPDNTEDVIKTDGFGETLQI